MTLFAHSADQHEVFDRVLDRYYHGEPDDKTLQILEKLKGK